MDIENKMSDIQKGYNVESEVEYLKSRVKKLEDENIRLKRLLNEAGISYECSCNQIPDISLEKARLFFHTFGEGRTYMLKDMSIKVQVFLDISRNAATFGDMEYALKRIG